MSVLRSWRSKPGREMPGAIDDELETNAVVEDGVEPCRIPEVVEEQGPPQRLDERRSVGDEAVEPVVGRDDPEIDVGVLVGRSGGMRSVDEDRRDPIVARADGRGALGELAEARLLHAASLTVGVTALRYAAERGSP